MFGRKQNPYANNIFASYILSEYPSRNISSEYELLNGTARLMRPVTGGLCRLVNCLFASECPRTSACGFHIVKQGPPPKLQLGEKKKFKNSFTVAAVCILLRSVISSRSKFTPFLPRRRGRHCRLCNL